jgi:multidrug efflux pump
MMLGVVVAMVILNIALFYFVPKGFFPQQDTGRLGGRTVAAQDISFPAMRDKQRELAQMVLDDPAVETVTAFVGGGGPGGGSSNIGNMNVGLKPLKQRPGRVSSDAVVNRLRRKLTSVPGATLILQVQQEFQSGARGGAAQYQYTLSDENMSELNIWVPQMLDRMKAMREMRDVNTDQQTQGLAANLVIDRDAASRLGITPAAIDQVLYDAFGQRQVSTMYSALNQYFVVMGVAPQYQLSPDALNGIFIKAGSVAGATTGSARNAPSATAVLTPSTGAMVPLSAIAHFEQRRTALQVNHQGQYPAVTLTFNLAPNVALGDAVAAIEKAQGEMNMPASIHASFQGTTQAFQDVKKNMGWLVLAALTAVYIVLGILYESLIHPLTILSTLPPAGVGAILALMLTGTDLNIIALIGVILLIGIVIKNAIMMIDFALQAEREQGLPPVEAIYQACLLRFRPILMTSMSAIFGGLPLAIGMGVGSELRKPLGITIVGGLLVSQMLTLFTAPVVYLFFDRLQWRVMKLHRIGAELEEAAAD